MAFNWKKECILDSTLSPEVNGWALYAPACLTRQLCWIHYCIKSNPITTHSLPPHPERCSMQKPKCAFPQWCRVKGRILTICIVKNAGDRCWLQKAFSQYSASLGNVCKELPRKTKVWAASQLQILLAFFFFLDLLRCAKESLQCGQECRCFMCCCLCTFCHFRGSTYVLISTPTLTPSPALMEEAFWGQRNWDWD